jgi:DNA-binding transcriptional MocR family regulator
MPLAPKAAGLVNMLQYKIINIVKHSQIKGSTAAEIASSIERVLHAGPQASGQLPTIRELAATLRVSPVTVAAAYRLLRTRGLAVGHGRRGTRLRPQTVAQAHTARAASMAEGVIDLATGNPDPDLLPPIDVALRTVSAAPHLYGEPLELRPLIAFAAAEFEADGIPSDAVTVTSGALDAVERVLREHLRAGDRVVVEDPTLPALLDLLASLALTPQPCALDDHGVEPGAFERALGPQVRAVIVTPRAQNPTGAAMTTRRAADLSRALRRRPQVVLIEIDPAGPVSGVSAVTLVDPSREHWAVVKSTSKFLGPDLRVALMAGDALTVARVQRRQALGVRWVSHLLQRLTLALWSDPSNGRRLARAADVYAQRRSALSDALAASGIAAHARSGFNMWIPVGEETATVQSLAERGWAVAPGERFRLRSAPAIRVTTSALAPDEARRFAADLAAVLESRGAALG